MTIISLPSTISDLVAARNKVRDHYSGLLHTAERPFSLSFEFDGNLVGDPGEALAIDLFDMTLTERRGSKAFDGTLPSGRSVQVKATATKHGPAFRFQETRADDFLFFALDLENLTAEIVYNGPEHYVRAMLPAEFVGQHSLTPAQIRAADQLVQRHERLQRRAMSIHEERL